MARRGKLAVPFVLVVPHSGKNPGTLLQSSRRDTSLGDNMEWDFWDSRFVMSNSPTRFMEGEHRERGACGGWLRPSCLPISIILILIVLVVLIPVLTQTQTAEGVAFHNQVVASLVHCRREPSTCRMELVESIPENVSFATGPTLMSTFTAWKKLLNSAVFNVSIASFYWTLKGSDVIPDPSDWQGEEIFNLLMETGKKDNITMKIVQNKPSWNYPDHNTKELQEVGAAEVRNLDMKRLTGGVLHTKMWLVDGHSAYLGSANMDWRSLTQVKELGVLIENCPCVVGDLQKIFKGYWITALPKAEIPIKWPSELNTPFDMYHPLIVPVNDGNGSIFFGSAPPSFCPDGRSTDLDAILHVIQSSHEFVHVSVMDYFPCSLYSAKVRYWPLIDDALREAAIERKVQVRLLISLWNHTRPDLFYYLRSLSALNGVLPGVQIEVRLFQVPALSTQQAQIPFARVNHNKYMVTESTAYIGTSNWSEDYFTQTGGVGLVVGNSSLHKDLELVFQRDWDSKYSSPVPAPS